MSIEGYIKPGKNESADSASSMNDAWTLSSGLFGNPIPKGVGSEYFNKLKLALIEIYKSSDPAVEINVLELTRMADQALDYSCLLVCMQLRSTPTLGVAYHILLLSKTGDSNEDEASPYIVQIGNTSVNVFSYPSDSVDSTLVNKASAVVSAHYKTNKVFFVDSTVLFENFNATDPQALQGLALNSALACATELRLRSPDFSDLNLAKLTKVGNTVIELDFARQTLTGITGEPFRSGFTTKLIHRKNNESKTGMRNTGDRLTIVTELSSFMDVLWNPTVDSNPFAMAFPMGGNNNNKKFVARQVMTNIRNNFPPTPSAVLLAIATALSTREPKYWIQAFNSNMSNRKEHDMYNVGALNIEGNLPVQQENGTIGPDPSNFGKIINTKSDNFTAEQLGMLISTLFQTDIMYAVDVPESGSESHYLGVFLAAIKQEGARNRIIAAANSLTNGEFARHFKQNDSLFASAPERIHAGTWIDTNGKIRDLRDFDYLAVANIIGAKEPTFLKDWSDTFLRLDYPEIQRLEARRSMIRRLSGDTAKFKGFYQRLTFSKEFLNSLDKGIASQNFVATIRSPHSGNEYLNPRGTASWATGAMVSNTASGFTTGNAFSGNIGQSFYGNNGPVNRF